MSPRHQDPGHHEDLAGLDEPVRRFFEQIARPASTGSAPDLAAIGAALVELAADADYWTQWMRRLDDSPGSLWVHAPQLGPRLSLVHRPEGQLSAVHDHGTWVAVAPVAGVEAHRRYAWDPSRPTTLPHLVDVRALNASDVLTMLPPDDVHDHGHLAGQGTPAHVLILTGDDQRRYTRHEWDLPTGRHRLLAPGVSGRWLASEPMPAGS
jgi:predicted metal-dependent enzyme (double-stranded beta helix superfamily)